MQKTALVLVTAFLENVKKTEKLEVSLGVLNNSDLLKKLNETTINILTVELQSTCKLHQVIKHYSLPSCLTVIRISDNYLSFQDAFALGSSVSSVNGLQELDLSRTKFEEGSFYAFISILTKCSNLRKLFLADNSLTEKELACFTTAFESINNITHLSLSKNNLRESQASNILKNIGEPKSIDLSQNALEGSRIINRICQLQSLQELNLSHNYIRFFPLPKLDHQHDSLPVNTQIISLSSNNMTPKDIGSFCSLIRSHLLKLILDFNHVGYSIWALCFLKIKRVKVLSLANTDVCGPAAEHLAFLLSSLQELEELDLSSNNLTSNDFPELQEPLSNVTQLKRLNLSNNPDGILCVLQQILPSLKHLEELRLRNVHLNGEDFSKISASLASLRGLKRLDLSGNAIGPNGATAFAEILKEFPLLEKLDLSNSCMKEDDTNILCTELTILKNLKYLNLSGNRIDGEVLNDSLLLPSLLEEVIFSNVIHGEKLFAKMKALQYLRKLRLSEIKLRRCDGEAFASMLSSFSLLEELALANVDVTESKWERIFNTIKLLKSAGKLHLSGIKILDEKALVEMLSSLSHLEELEFSGVELENMSGFFNALESLRCLKNLDLRETRISKTDAEALAAALPSLHLLEKLALGEIERDNESQKQLFDAIGKLRYLKKLNLEGAKITQTGTQALTAALPSLQLLEELALGWIDCDHRSQKQLSCAVGKLRYLKKLDVGGPKITPTGLKALAAALPSLQLLEELTLWWRCGNKKSQKHLFDAVGKLRYLKKFNLQNAKITPTGTEALAAALPSLQLLEELALEWIFWDNESQKQLFDAVGKLRYLKKLNLEVVVISPTGLEALTAALPSLQLLEELVLGIIEHHDDESQKQLFDATGKLKYLKRLYVDFDKITRTGAEALARELPSLQLLEGLEFIYVDFDNEMQKQVFENVRKLKYLKILNLYGTRITRIRGEALAAALPSLQLLEELQLGRIDQGNESQKQLFDAVGKLRYLKKLTLETIKITPTGTEALAAALPSLQLLEELALRWIDLDNESQERLFDAVGKLRYLKELRLYEIATTQNNIAALADTLPSLNFLEMLALGNKVVTDELWFDQVITAVRSLRFLKQLHLRCTYITRTGAVTLVAMLPTLRNLKSITLPLPIRDPQCDEDRTLREKFDEAARRVPGLVIEK